ncbi:MAG: ABC transporter ATP-binding protein [Patescibacteria group bacterium]
MKDGGMLLTMIKSAYRGLWLRYGFIVLLIFLGVGLTVVEPVLFGRIFDVVVGSLTRNEAQSLLSSVAGILGLWAAAGVLNIIISIATKYALWHTNNVASNRFANDVLRNLLLWSRERFSRNKAGRIIKIADESWQAVFHIPTLVSDLLPTLLTFIVVLVVGFILDWRLTVAALSIVPVSIGMGVYAWKRAAPKQDYISQQWSELTSHFEETVSNISVIQNFAQEPQRQSGFARILRDTVKQQLRLDVFWAIFDGGGGSLYMVGRFCVFIVGIVLVARQEVTVGVFITFLSMSSYLFAPVQYAIANNLPRLTKQKTALRLYAELMAEENDVVEHSNAKQLTKVDGAIEVRNVSFRYRDQSASALRGISLTIPAGTSCALVGPSGAGKSTLIKLLNRTIDPTQGAIMIDGRDVREYTLQSLRRQIGVVTQETYLFHNTIFNNVRFVQPKATRKQVIEACKKAQAHGFISKLPKGYDSIVGERGVKLSGGERQRIALARIFLADPPILVLDESTSALDSETEKRVQESLQEVMEGRTTIVIAHRLSTIYLADQIAVVENGRIVDLGTHDTLIKKGGLYDRLWSLQAGGYIV